MPAARPRPRNYEMVGGGATGHAESVEITFDPSKISYGKILQIYFSVAHDPTAAQPPGTGHRPAVSLGDLSHHDEQARVAKAYIAQLDQAQVYRRHDRHDHRSRPTPSIRPRTIIRIT